MGRGINHVVLIGSVSEHRANAAGKQRFRMTTVESYTRDGEQLTSESWVWVVGQPGLVLLQNADVALAIGRVDTNTYTNKEGITSKRTEVTAQSLVVVDPNAEHQNLVVWNGRMATTPELRTTAGGRPLAKFRMATGGQFTTSQGESVDTSAFLDMTVWGGLAALIAERLAKGDQVTLSGRIASRTYTTAEGEAREATDLTVVDVQLPDRPKAAPAPKGTAAPVLAGGGDDGLL